jgi:D-proline reductase (dithiol) PrdB
MPRLADLPLWLRTTLKLYRWRRIEPVPCAPLNKALARCRVALVSSAGLVAPGQAPFDKSVKGGDYSYRVIPGKVEVQSLIETHRSEAFDHRGVEEDRNLAFPLDRLHELAGDGVVGEVAPRHLSFMGSITAPGRLVKRTVPEVAALLIEDQVDIALLIPI